MIEENIDCNSQTEWKEGEHGEPDNWKGKQTHANHPHKTYTRSYHHYSVQMNYLYFYYWVHAWTCKLFWNYYHFFAVAHFKKVKVYYTICKNYKITLQHGFSFITDFINLSFKYLYNYFLLKFDLIKIDQKKLVTL